MGCQLALPCNYHHFACFIISVFLTQAFKDEKFLVIVSIQRLRLSYLLVL